MVGLLHDTDGSGKHLELQQGMLPLDKPHAVAEEERLHDRALEEVNGALPQQVLAPLLATVDISAEPTNQVALTLEALCVYLATCV